MGKLVIETELSTKQFDKQIARLKSDLDRYTKTLKSDAQVPISLRMSAEEKANLEATIEKTRNQLISLQSQAEKVGNVGEEAGVKSGQGFEKGIKSLKRFSLALFGIRSMFTLVRRTTSSYLSEHEETANKINAIWVALGNALGPIIEIIADGVLKLVGYLNVFLQALGFDIDLTKNMNKSKNAIKDTTKAMKDLNKQLATFDEINAQQKESTSEVDGGSIENTFKMPELNQKLVKFLQDVAKCLKDNWELLGLIALAIGGFKVAKWLGAIGTLIGGGTGASAVGLLGLTSILKGLATIGTIAIVISLIYYGMQLHELKELNEELDKSYEKITKNQKNTSKTQLENAKQYEKGSNEIKRYVSSLKDNIEASKINIEAMKEENKQGNLFTDILDTLTGTTSKNNKIMDENIERMITDAECLQELKKQGKLTDDQMKLYNDTMKYLNSIYDDVNENIQFGISALNHYDKQAKITSDNQKGYVSSILENTKKVVGEMNKLKATPEVQFKANTDEIQNALKSLASVMGTNATFLINKIKNVGLAKGGIFNNPGKGVSMSNVVVGEATGGTEGVIPMNNEQSMDLIGQSIAKHVIINLTSTTLLDNKTIARQQNKIIDATNFATNGRGVR